MVFCELWSVPLIGFLAMERFFQAFFPKPLLPQTANMENTFHLAVLLQRVSDVAGDRKQEYACFNPHGAVAKVRKTKESISKRKY